jgi:hypothetical protein
MSDLDEVIKEEIEKARGSELLTAEVLSDSVDPLIVLITDKGKLYIGMNDIGIFEFRFEPFEEKEKK